jgi:hypothetical protein
MRDLQSISEANSSTKDEAFISLYEDFVGSKSTHPLFWQPTLRVNPQHDEHQNSFTLPLIGIASASGLILVASASLLHINGFTATVTSPVPSLNTQPTQVAPQPEVKLRAYDAGIRPITSPMIRKPLLQPVPEIVMTQPESTEDSYPKRSQPSIQTTVIEPESKVIPQPISSPAPTPEPLRQSTPFPPAEVPTQPLR